MTVVRGGPRQGRHAWAAGAGPQLRTRDRPRQRTTPSHQVYIGRVEIGAAWLQNTASDRDRPSVTRDVPKRSAPISADVFTGDSGGGDTVIQSPPRPM